MCSFFLAENVVEMAPMAFATDADREGNTYVSSVL